MSRIEELRKELAELEAKQKEEVEVAQLTKKIGRLKESKAISVGRSVGEGLLKTAQTIGDTAINMGANMGKAAIENMKEAGKREQESMKKAQQNNNLNTQDNSNQGEDYMDFAMRI